MGIDGSHWLGYGLILVLTTAGFHGLFFYRNIFKKALSWGAFQAGVLLLIKILTVQEGMASPNPLAQAMVLSSLAVLVGVLLALFTLCSVLWEKYETLDGEKLDHETQG